MGEGHWNLEHDPFRPGAGPFVATPSRAEALARLVYAIERGEPGVSLEAGAGLGKSMLLDQLAAALRDPRRRVARASAAADSRAMLESLARALGVFDPRSTGTSDLWRALTGAARLARVQGFSLVILLDDVHAAEDPALLERLGHLDARPGGRSTVVHARRLEQDRAPEADWVWTVRIGPLTRAEADEYLATKLAAAGRVEPAFTARAITALHALSGGVPRGLDRLASLSLAAGAVRRLELVTPDLVEGVHAACEGPPTFGEGSAATWASPSRTTC